MPVRLINRYGGCSARPGHAGHHLHISVNSSEYALPAARQTLLRLLSIASPEAQLIHPQPILSLPAVHAPRPFTSPRSLQRPTKAARHPFLMIKDAQASASCALSIPQKRLSNQARPTEWRMACGTELSTRDVRVMLDSDKCALRVVSGRLRDVGARWA